MSARVLRGLSKSFITLLYLISTNAGNFLVKKMIFQPPDDYEDDRSIVRKGENCWIFIPSTVHRSISIQPIIVFLHGNASDVSMNKEIGKLLSGIGDVYIPEYPGYGAMRKYFPRKNTDGIMTTLRNFFENVIDPLRNGRSVCIIGQSLGTHYATRLACEGYCNQLCLVSPFYSIERVAFEDKHMVGIMEYNTSEYMKTMPKNISTLFLHGGKDMVVPCSHSRDLYGECNVYHKRIEIFPGMGHCNMDSFEIAKDVTRLIADYGIVQQRG